MAKTSKTPRERVHALLNKTLENGCEEGEEAMAVAGALKIIVKYHLTIGDYVFPPRYDKAGQKIPLAVVEPAPETPRRTRIIKQACESALLEITGTDANGHTTGHAYEEILRRVKVEFPSCNTSIKCLRWYATHMKEQGCKMPQKRDRPSPKLRQPAVAQAQAA